MADRYAVFEKYNFQVPRYTSYPPATQFRESEGQDQHISWLESAHGALSLYIHIPFCARLCHYCGCNMRVVNTYDPVVDYLDVLQHEIRQIKQHLFSKTHITHLHFGGGSPTILKPTDFANLIDFLKENFSFDPSIEISVEADPRNLSEGKVAAYARSGVNRLSMGVQDFDDDVLRMINRPQPFSVTYRAAELCRNYGINNLNFDLMYGLPGQTKTTISRTFELALSLTPSRIAYFGYAHVPWMKRHMTLLPENQLPDSRGRYILQQMGAQMLQDAGYVPVGIDHFCLPEDSMSLALRDGRLHRNFQGYTTDTAQTLVALGASSISAFPDGFIQNRVDLRKYMMDVRGGLLPSHKTLSLSKDDKIRGRVIEQLMCYLEVDLARIRDEFSLAPDYFCGTEDRLHLLAADGIAAVNGDRITIDPAYRVLARVVCDAFDAYSARDMNIKRHARAV